ncbi:ribose-5-phosphate isomerase RpiA [Bradyrhizobium sp. LHD-71]|uniref:ribose-5-phosphate isomerase RpiA n=1 Tax=Bradyrhizobium sp. LHD-71 TaxID=3072141 RepID=UPI00280D23FD|nr:ribose-5-phosphate isomerase RpiA [Bradyrhizobium sp. LHD-71]MDQ8728637.1 ribose-5-phosphate isomerase RpiA [Bradyrhizobium sp. LHD-71]
MDLEGLKRQAAARALEDVRDGMRLGLGTGSTARHFVDLLGERVRAGLNVVGVPTSEATRAQAEQCGIALTTLDETPQLDLTVDGADEIDPALNLIKGAGGALLREKIVAAASSRMTVIADTTKWVDTLGRFPLSIEVMPFGLGATRAALRRTLEEHGCPADLTLRAGAGGLAFVTDGGHWIVDAKCQQIPDAGRLAVALNGIPGVVEHGLFIGLATKVILADPAGVRVIERPVGR